MKWEGVGDYFLLMGSQPHIRSELVDLINTYPLSTFSKLLALMGGSPCLVPLVLRFTDKEPKDFVCFVGLGRWGEEEAYLELFLW